VSGTDPVAPAFIAGYGPLPGDFNGWVQAPFAFLTSKIVFRAEHHSSTSLPASANTLIKFDTVLEDPYSGWSSGAGTWTCPAGCSGWYGVTMTATGSNPGNATSVISALIALNGTVVQSMSSEWSADGHSSGAAGSYPVSLYGGQDAISGWIYTSTAVSTPTTNGQWPTMEICWISL
jgi:hypothetical protein